MNNLQEKTPSALRRILSRIRQGAYIPFNIALVFCLVTGSLYMQITAHQHKVDLGWFVGLCAVFSVGSVLLYVWEHSSVVELYIAFAAGLGLAFAFGPVSASVSAFLNVFRQRFGLVVNGYVIKPAQDSTLFFVMLAFLACLLAAAYLMRSGTIWMAAAIPALSFVLATARFREQCSPRIILAVLGAFIVVLLTHRVRRIDTQLAAKQSMVISLPVAAILVVLALLIRPEAYTLPSWGQQVKEQTDAVFSKVFAQVEKEEYFGSTQLYRTKFALDELGPRPNDRRRVMEVFADEKTDLYLRGFSYIGYRDGTWVHETPEQAKAFSGVLEHPLSVPENDLKEYRIGTVMIRTDRDNDMIYLPYTASQIPDRVAVYGDSYVNNTIKLREYSVSYGSLGTVNHGRTWEYEQLVYEHYLEIPEETAQALREMAVENGIITAEEAQAGCPQDVPAAVERLMEFTGNSAKYDTKTQPMPAGKDFALWFFTEAESGYCSHFASAATLMLRAIGVPARFTSGFVAHTEAGEWVKVTGDNAHAWVEYYDKELGGWVVEDPTHSLLQPGFAPGETESLPVSESDALYETSGTDEVPVVSGSNAESNEPAPEPALPEEMSAPDAVSGENEEQLSSDDMEPAGSEGSEDAGAGCSAWRAVPFAAGVSAVLTALCLVLARRDRNKKRQSSFSEGSNKERITAMSEYLQVLKDAGAGSWSTPVRSIMLKAQFSQHDLTDSERELVEESVAQSVEAVKANSNLLADLRNRYIRFIY